MARNCWFAKNLATTALNDGTKLKEHDDNADWASASEAAYCWFDNDSVNYADPYGALYNKYTVETEKLCPAGWHVPSNEEWLELGLYFENNMDVAGGYLKEAGTSHWQTPNTGAANSNGFGAVGGGIRNKDAQFLYLDQYGSYWSSNISSTNNTFYMSYNNAELRRSDNNMNAGISVRCVKD
ncbi:MAG: hypothetical protein HC896_17985 [Bacteroidales bacterium]|nr:hypothetical protein [Bacteroidales bacterium]